ncbi:MAG: hypothetical protein HDR06_02055 [Lachnospiraceae bacterium]|nr:hypothetical protein [Lachnospiraceae bacterium]
MKVSKRDVLLLLGLLGILAAVCSYFLVYQPTMEKADALEEENEELNARIADLSSKMNNKDSYVEQTESMNREMETIFMEFPIDVREEDSILLAVNQELIAPMQISSISIGPCEPVILQSDDEEIDHTYEIEQIEEYETQEGIQDETMAEAADASVSATGNMPSVLMSRNVTTNYLVSYDGLKRSIKNISIQDNRMSIDNLTVSYDESTGLLTGTTSVDMYCIPGQADKEYVTPNLSSVLLGSDNIFGSIELYGERGLADLEDNDSENADEDAEEED